MHVVCGQRHRHRITQPGKGQHCVCARACVYVCVHTRMCVAWAGYRQLEALLSEKEDDLKLSKGNKAGMVVNNLPAKAGDARDVV